MLQLIKYQRIREPSNTRTTSAACNNVSTGIKKEKLLSKLIKYEKAVVIAAGKLPMGKKPIKTETRAYNAFKIKVKIIQMLHAVDVNDDIYEPTQQSK